jgi:hypothetical protein
MRAIALAEQLQRAAGTAGRRHLLRGRHGPGLGLAGNCPRGADWVVCRFPGGRFAAVYHLPRLDGFGLLRVALDNFSMLAVISQVS